MIRALVDRLLGSYRFRQALEALIRARVGHARFAAPADLSLPEVPARYGLAGPPADGTGEGAIFVTARFRTGSTFLWQLFNRLEGYAAFYEPLNERHGPGNTWGPVDPTHRGASDYRLHYDRAADARRLHREAWSFENLYMDEGDWDPDLYDYIRGLCALPGAVPVLQFNRVDFRLRWLRTHFPGARIVHLFRNPRDQWISALGKAPLTSAATVADFEPHDRFYLLTWARDLARVYPFLAPEAHRTPYALHYLIWRLSHAHGVRHADVSVAYEELCADPAAVMGRVLACCGREAEPRQLAGLSSLADPPVEARWSRFAPASWFEAVEADCERILRAAFPVS